MQAYRARLGLPFPHTDYLDRLTGLRDELKVGLSGSVPEGSPNVADLAGQIKALLGPNVVEATPGRTEKRLVSAEEPVTARILRKAEAPTGIKTVDEEDAWQQRTAPSPKQFTGRI
jgi:hypothetical protein